MNSKYQQYLDFLIPLIKAQTPTLDSASSEIKHVERTLKEAGLFKSIKTPYKITLDPSYSIDPFEPYKVIHCTTSYLLWHDKRLCHQTATEAYSLSQEEFDYCKDTLEAYLCTQYKPFTSTPTSEPTPLIESPAEIRMQTIKEDAISIFLDDVCRSTGTNPDE